MTHPFFIPTHSVYSMHFLRSHCIPSPELGTEDTDKRERSLPEGSRDFVGSAGAVLTHPGNAAQHSQPPRRPPPQRRSQTPVCIPGPVQPLSWHPGIWPRCRRDRWGKGVQGAREGLVTHVSLPQPQAPLPPCKGWGQHCKSLEQRLAQRRDPKLVCPTNG